MSMIRTLTMLAALAAGAAACHDKATDKPGTEKASGAEVPAAPGAPATAQLVPQADAERFYTFIEQLVAVAVANQDDCAKLAAAINAHVDANKALLDDAAAMKKQYREMPPPIKDKMAKKFSAELGPAITKKCATDQAVRASFAKLRAR